MKFGKKTLAIAMGIAINANIILKPVGINANRFLINYTTNKQSIYFERNSTAAASASGKM